MSITYSADTRVRATEAIAEATTFETQREALNHWHVFIEEDLPRLLEGENEVGYVDEWFRVLKEVAVEWRIAYQLDLLTEAVNEGRRHTLKLAQALDLCIKGCEAMGRQLMALEAKVTKMERPS